jgi:hypothetical protein
VTYEHFASGDQLGAVVPGAGAGRGLDPPVPPRAGTGRGGVSDKERSTSKSAVSRTFVQRTRAELWNRMNRPDVDLRLAVMMLDGIELHGRMKIVAFGLSTALKLALTQT